MRSRPRRPRLALAAALAAAALLGAHATGAHQTGHDDEPPAWTLTAAVIEASTGAAHCSHAATGGGAAGTPCAYNRALEVRAGTYGKVALAGARLWMAGAVAAAAGPGEHEWGAIAFDSAVTPEQREGLLSIVRHLYPVQWLSFTVALPAAIAWESDDDGARATLAGGERGEIVLAPLPREGASAVVPAPPARYGAATQSRDVVTMRAERSTFAGAQSIGGGPATGLVATIEITSAH